MDSNPIVNNFGPTKTNRCDAATIIEGCSQVPQPIPPQTDPPVNTKEETTDGDKGRNLKTMKLAKKFPIPFPVEVFALHSVICCLATF